MARQKGSDMLLKVDTTGSLNFVTIGGGQNLSHRIGKPITDVSNQGSASKHREGLEGASITEFSVSGDGVFTSDAPASTVAALALAGTHRNWQVIVPGEGTYQGLFQITTYERRGKHDAEVTFTIALESVGLISGPV